MTQRYHAFDALRGLIMILMAIDHSSAFISREHGSEWWAGAMSSYNDGFVFLTRWITHLCAPGFFFLMGAGICWFAESRRKAGWNEGRFAGRVALRGLALLVLAQFFEAPLMFVQGKLAPPAAPLIRVTAPPPIDGSDLYWGLITLSGLGMVMMTCAGLLRLPRWAWWLTLAGSVFATNTLLPASGKPGPLWMTVLLAPGLSEHVIVIYPLLPWLGAAAGGMLFAGWWQRDPEHAGRRLVWLGLGLVALACALRFAGGWGNIRPPRDAGWIEFLNNVKYPPSLVFLAMSIGIDLLLLAGLRRVVSERSPLLVYGQTPLFFFFAHFLSFMALGFLLFREPGTIAHTYLVWAIVVVALYPACVWYRRFKLSKPAESLWRMF